MRLKPIYSVKMYSKLLSQAASWYHTKRSDFAKNSEFETKSVKDMQSSEMSNLKDD